MGINEVTKYLEATAAKKISERFGSNNPTGSDYVVGSGSPNVPAGSASDSALGSKSDSGFSVSASGPAPDIVRSAIVLICRDVRPARLVEHLHSLVVFTGADVVD